MSSFFYISPQAARSLAKTKQDFNYLKSVGSLSLHTGAKLRYSLEKCRYYVQSFHYSYEDIEPYKKYQVTE